jgi:hypothetical protein
MKNKNIKVKPSKTLQQEIVMFGFAPIESIEMEHSKKLKKKKV